MITKSTACLGGATRHTSSIQAMTGRAEYEAGGDSADAAKGRGGQLWTTMIEIMDWRT